jgi:hypothetical protein
MTNDRPRDLEFARIDIPEVTDPLEAMKKAVNDLWSTIARHGDNYVVFYDHFAVPARIRFDGSIYRIAWAEDPEGDGNSVWTETERTFENPREAAFYAFQGSDRANQADNFDAT